MSNISVFKIFNGSAIVQNNAITETVNLERYDCEGFFSMQIAIVGAGNVDVIWSASNDGTNFIIPVGASDIYSAFGASSGPSSDGHSIISFDPLICKFMKFTATEQNAGAITSIVCHLAIQ